VIDSLHPIIRIVDTVLLREELKMQILKDQATTHIKHGIKGARCDDSLHNLVHCFGGKVAFLKQLITTVISHLPPHDSPITPELDDRVIGVTFQSTLRC